MTLDLTWTGSQFLDRRGHTEGVLRAAADVDVTSKDEVWAESVAAAIAAHHGIPAGMVRVSAGATQMIDCLLRSLPHALVLDVVPNFHLTATICRQEGWGYRRVAVREPGELLPALEPYLGREDTLISLSSPRNPLGYQFAVSDIATLLGRTSGPVILDEVYVDFAPDSGLSLLAEHPSLFVVRTLSKAWGLANLRIGYGASAAFAGEEDPGSALRLVPNAVSGVAQRAALHLLSDPRAVRGSIDTARATRERMVAALRELPGLRVWPTHANYVCVESPAAGELAAALAHSGYRARLLHELRGYPSDWPPGLRISVPPPPHDEAVVACLRAFLTAGRGGEMTA